MLYEYCPLVVFNDEHIPSGFKLVTSIQNKFYNTTNTSNNRVYLN